MILSSAIGTFEFQDQHYVRLVDAKAIRDTVMSGFLTSPPGRRPVRSPQEMVNHLGEWHHRANNTPFDFVSSVEDIPSLSFDPIGLTKSEAD